MFVLPAVRQAFTKVTHLEPDHGEAWTNLAALWLQRGGAREALHASEQAIKYKRDSWQTWENYATAAAKAGVMPACVRALSQVRSMCEGHLMVGPAFLAGLIVCHKALLACPSSGGG